MNKKQPFTVVDIGACVGIFIDYCLIQHAKARVYAFEPLEANYRFLQQKYTGDARVTLFPQAVADFNGRATLYKKRYVKKALGFFPHLAYDFAGNEGSSLKGSKSNVSHYHVTTVDVVRFRDLVDRLGLDHIDLLKIDSEGTEYDILLDLLAANLYKRITTIYFEDHTRKVPGLEPARNQFMAHVKELGIAHKFFTQQDHLTYIPLSHATHY